MSCRLISEMCGVPSNSSTDCSFATSIFVTFQDSWMKQLSSYKFFSAGGEGGGKETKSHSWAGYVPVPSKA